MTSISKTINNNTTTLLNANVIKIDSVASFLNEFFQKFPSRRQCPVSKSKRPPIIYLLLNDRLAFFTKFELFYCLYSRKVGRLELGAAVVRLRVFGWRGSKNAARLSVRLGDKSQCF